MDTQKKKILILHSSAGHGHENAAKAIEEACRLRDPEADVRCVDALDHTARIFSTGYRRTYLFLIDRLPTVWGFFYYLLDNAFLDMLVRPFRRMFNSFFGGGLERLIVSERPDVIVCTHFFPLEVAGWLKKKKKTGARLGVVVTDYLPHYFWAESSADFYAAAIQQTKDGLIKRGVPGSKIRVLGIPIESKFETKRSRQDAAAVLGVKSEFFTALLTSGGAGIGCTGEIAKRLLSLDAPLQILAVCGNNRLLFEELSVLGRTNSRLKVFSFVKNMEVLMEASDLVIGKSGGLTLTESLSKNKPMVILRPVAGQETRNAECVKLYRAGFVAHSVSEAVSLVLSAMGDRSLFEQLKDGVVRMTKPNAAKDIAVWALGR